VNFIKAEAKVATDPVFSRRILERIDQDDRSKYKKGNVQKYISGVTISRVVTGLVVSDLNGQKPIELTKTY
jgi:hypothetical protein